MRVATTEDAGDIARIQHDSWLTTYSNEEAGITRVDLEDHLGDVEGRARRWKNRLGLEAKEIDFIGVTLVLQVDGRTVGFCKVARGNHAGHVDALYLSPEYAKRGLGNELFQKGLQWLGNEEPIDLEVATYNSSAIRFYERYGFRKQGGVTPLRLAGGKEIPLMLMVRDRQEE